MAPRINQPNWDNRTLFVGDNLRVMRNMESNSVPLIYLDPPYNSNRKYYTAMGGTQVEVAFVDAWTPQHLDQEAMGELAEINQGLADACNGAMAHSEQMRRFLIMMSLRLLELYRILWRHGSIWLHVDQTAGHYLKPIMDAIFGAHNFRSEIIWKSVASVKNNTKHKFGRAHDILFFYARRGAKVDIPHTPLDEEYVQKTYRNRDRRGRYMPGNLLAPGKSGGYEYNFLGTVRRWQMPPEKAQQLLVEDRIIHRTTVAGSMRNVAMKKVYLHESKGKPCSDVWTDVSPLHAHSKEYVEFDTQKPVALLKRIIETSSNEGDIVFDPFAGCATTCVTAELMGRQWVGIDIAENAVFKLQQRLNEAGDKRTLLYGGKLKEADPIIRYHDKGYCKPVRPLRLDTRRHRMSRSAKDVAKRVLYGREGGEVCNGCDEKFNIRNMTIDHINPDGGDHIDNFQLLCGWCNSTKGDRSMAYLHDKVNKMREDMNGK